MAKKTFLLILLLMAGCGGIKQESNSSGTPKITTNPTSISYKTQYGDAGSWNSNQVIISTYSTESSKDNPVEGEVTISYSSSYVKVYNQSGGYITTGTKLTTSGGTQTLRIDYYSNGKNKLEYETSVILQFQSAAATISISVKKPDNVNISIKSSPDKIEDKSESTDTGTWNSKTVAVTLFADTTAISDSVFVFTSGKTEYISVTDTSGNNLSAGTITTDSDGKALLYVKYYTKKNLEYTASIQVFYGNYSATTAINITKKTADIYTTTIIPTEYSYNATSDDKGTWRYQNFTVNVKDSKGNYAENANINLSISSEYTYLSINGQDMTNYVATTNSSGTHTVKVKYYTQSTTKVEYTASLAANEAIATIKVTSDGPGKITTKVSPSSFQYKAGSDDAGTYREEQFNINTVYQDGTAAESANVSLSVSSSYTKLIIDGTEYTNYSATTNSKGYLNIKVKYYTQSSPTKVEYTSTLTANDISVPISITSEGKSTITTTLTPDSYEYKAKSDDTGTWREQNYTIYTKDQNNYAAANKAINIAASSSYTKLYIGSTEYNSYSTTTNSSGYYSLLVRFYTEKGLEYNSTISANEATSTIKVTAEATAKTVTTITPSTFSYKAGSDDTGTWREQNYTIYTKDQNGNNKGNAALNLAVSSPYTKLYIGNTEYTTYSTTTNSSGYYNLTVKYYTQATTTKVEYTSTLMANDATSSISITADSASSTTYNITISPSSLSYTYAATDTGTWRTQYFVIVVSDSSGKAVSGANVTITSPHSQYTKLNGATDTIINVTSGSNGQYNLKTEYYTEADYSVSPTTKKTWSGYLTITSGTATKQVQFTIN